MEPRGGVLRLLAGLCEAVQVFDMMPCNTTTVYLTTGMAGILEFTECGQNTDIQAVIS